VFRKAVVHMGVMVGLNPSGAWLVGAVQGEADLQTEVLIETEWDLRAPALTEVLIETEWDLRAPTLTEALESNEGIPDAYAAGCLRRLAPHRAGAAPFRTRSATRAAAEVTRELAR
jgi:hypothetical protein